LPILFSLTIPASTDALHPTRKEIPVTTLILLACSIAALVLVWRFRQRLAHHIPRKETMSTAILVASIALLATFALLPDIVVLVSSMNLLPPLLKIVLVLAAVAGCIGCSKKADKPQPTRWSAPETGYHAETIPPDNKPKEGP
jgi:peptidoglycan/LPS O-acetylase OafA/YrhL